MNPWTNADVHIYIDRDNRWRARISVTYRGEPLQFYVPERCCPGLERAHGLVPLFLQIIGAFDALKNRS